MNYTIVPNKEVRIAISGKSGCGNTTVSTLLSEALKIPMINYTFRSLASETGMSLAEIIEKAKTDDSFDITVDTKQVEMAKESSCVLGSRLAIFKKLWILLQCGTEKIQFVIKNYTKSITMILTLLICKSILPCTILNKSLNRF